MLWLVLFSNYRVKTWCRISHRKCSVRKGVPRNFAKLTGKHLCQRTPFLQNTSGRLLLLMLSDVTNFIELWHYVVCTPPPSLHPSFLQGGVWTSYQIFKKEGLDRTLILRGRLVRKRGWPFWEREGGLCNFYVKNKPKSEIRNDKKYW